jgi:hypothetical protein
MNSLHGHSMLQECGHGEQMGEKLKQARQVARAEALFLEPVKSISH